MDIKKLIRENKKTIIAIVTVVVGVIGVNVAPEQTEAIVGTLIDIFTVVDTAPTEVIPANDNAILPEAVGQ